MIDHLKIESLAYGGDGVGRHNGKTIFVPFSVPGDVVRCRMVQEKKRYARAHITQLISPSPERCEPKCPVFGQCGGCQWQHMPYALQNLWKNTIFNDILRRQCKVPDDVLAPIVPSADEWGYRSRVQLKCHMGKEGFFMGFYRRESHFVIDVKHCPIMAPRLNETLQLFRQWLPSAPSPNRIPQLDMEVDDEGKVRVIIHFIGSDRDALKKYLCPLAQETEISLFLQTGRKDSIFRITGDEDLHILPTSDRQKCLAYGPGGFAQVNLAQNRQLVSAVLNAAELTGKERVLDLFCGMGNFSLPLAEHSREVVGIENYSPSIEKARENALRWGADNAKFHARPAEALTTLKGARKFDLVVLDPPRTGARQVVKELLNLRPERILYVSCDPPTLARDLTPLVYGGYKIVRSQPFDLFPQTFHTESLTVLGLS